MADFEEVELSGSTFQIPKNTKELNYSVAMCFLKNKILTFMKVSFFWGFLYLFLSFIGGFDLIIFLFSVFFITFAVVSIKQYSLKMVISFAIVVLIIAAFNMYVGIFDKELSLSSRIFWSFLGIVQAIYSIDLFLYSRKFGNVKISKLDEDIYRNLTKLFNKIAKIKPRAENSILEFVCYGTYTRVYKVFVFKNKVFIVDARNKYGFVDELKNLSIDIKNKKILQSKYDVKISTAYDNYKGVMKIADFEKYTNMKATN